MTIQTVTKYRATDGSEWATIEEAVKRERLIAGVRVAMNPLVPCPDAPDFSNGMHGYIQQDKAVVRSVTEALIAIADGTADEPGPLRWWFDSQEKDHGKRPGAEVHPSWFGRILDGAHQPLDRAFYRLCCIDSQGREWGQSYFANNPDEGKQVEYRQ